MDQERTGGLLARLRGEHAMTQRELAQRLGVSPQAVSKWERGLGCPDVALLASLAGIFGVSVERLLSGTLDPNEQETGNMKRLKFYVCPTCGNLLTATGSAEMNCCGRRLTPLTAQPEDAFHHIHMEEVEDEWYVTFDHPMDKNHYIRFFALLGIDRLMLVRLYPEQDGALRIPHLRGERLYLCCSRDGLFEVTG